MEERAYCKFVKKGDKMDPGNYRGITLLSAVGKVFCKILNDRLVQHFDEGQTLHEGQAGFRKKRSCVDNVRNSAGSVERG